MQQEVHLVNGLADQGSSAFHRPCGLTGAGVVGVGAMPLDICVGLKDPSEPSCSKSALEKENRIVEAMLTDDAELNSSRAGDGNHALCGLQVNGHGLLYQHMLVILGAQFD